MAAQDLQRTLLSNSQKLKFNAIQTVILTLSGFFSLCSADFLHADNSTELILPNILLGKEPSPLERLKAPRLEHFNSMDLSHFPTESLNTVTLENISQVNAMKNELLPLHPKGFIPAQVGEQFNDTSKSYNNQMDLSHQRTLISLESNHHVKPPLSGDHNEVRDLALKTEPLAQKKGGGQVIVVENGVNHVIPLAINHLNRVVIPFENPLVKTGSEFLMELEGKVIYVLLDTYEPVSLFITDPEEPLKTISLTLVAKKIAPRSIQLKVNFEEPNELIEENPLSLFSHHSTEKKETSLNQGGEIKQIFKELLNNRRPKGFFIRKKPHKAPFSDCQQRGLSFNFQEGLYLTSETQEVITGNVRNTSKEKQEIKLESCQSTVTIAVGFYPNQTLLPGASTTIILLKKKLAEDKKSQELGHEVL